MNVFRTAAVLLPLTCLVAQTPPPKPAPNPAGTPIPTVQSEIIQPQAGELPKVDPDKVNHTQGMHITFVTTADQDEEARELLKEFGMPFRTAS